MIKAFVLAVIVSVASSKLLKPGSKHAAVKIGAIAFVCSLLLDRFFLKSLKESFDATVVSKTADEAGLVFGNVLGSDQSVSTIYYSGMATSIANDANMYAGKSSVANSSVVTLTDMTDLSKVLNNLRIIALDVTSFDQLTPLKYGQLMSILHNEDHQDRYLCNINGKVTYGNAKKGDTSNVFQIMNKDDSNASGIVSMQTPFLICSSNNLPNSYLFVDTDGTIACSGSKDKATTFHLTDCLASCASETWRFL